MRLALFLFFLLSVISLYSNGLVSTLINDNNRISSVRSEIEKFYQLTPNQTWKEITQEVLMSPLTTESAKASILSHHRRIFVFRYPSEGLWIKGYISFTPKAKTSPTLILFRSGNRDFALPYPGDHLSTIGDYTTVTSTLRGGINEGRDEFGGKDVDDIKNMIDYLPTLNKELNFKSNHNCLLMIGPSRGGLEMFLTLTRYPELQAKVKKVVALSSILDLHQQIASRPNDMKQMLIDDFGYSDGSKGEVWIAQRDPLNTVSTLSKSLPILIIQGTADPRITLEEGQHMTKALLDSGHQVNYWEISGGSHTLTNYPQLTTALSTWLNRSLNCD